MKLKKIMLSIVSLALVITLVQVVSNNSVTIQDNKSEIIDGNTSVDLSGNTVTGNLVTDLVSNKVNNNKDYQNNDKDEFIDENGGLKVPFDQAYPEIFEEGDMAYSKETLMVKFSKSFDGQVNNSLKKAGIYKVEKMFDINDASWYTAYVKEGTDIKETMTSVRNMNNVVVAEYNFAYETAAYDVSGNADYSKQWHAQQYGIQEAWKYNDEEIGHAGGDSSVIVAVIDTGVDYTHKDLAANMWKNTNEVPDNGYDDDHNGYIDDYYGVDMTAYSGSGNDDHGHGTHVAGIIGAVNNNEGIVGLAYNTQIMAIKAGDASGLFLQDNIAKAIIYAFENGADVINMSFGGTASSIAVQDALAKAYNRCVLVASAGNDGLQNEMFNEYMKVMPNYPGAYSYVLGVMSVGSDNVESTFTNFDSFAFSGIEYEVYAPGEQIYSTIPGDRYTYMSGTSMASPVVAAQAALLRSYYKDRNTYPTKFIYGQIVGTAEDKVICCNPKNHLEHNIPGVINVYKSLTELPVPNVGMSDYTIFDTEGFESDTLNKNNGDGIVDSGETLALGFTLRNQWGMSKDTVVSLSATNEFGVTCPYVTLLNNNINYGSIGTYSEKDSGKVYTQDTWTGWENPFFIQVSKDCPNEYTIPLSLTITYKNALNEKDTSVYTNTAEINLKVRNGVIIPYYIEEDMVLTKDNYYIIPSSVTIAPTATVTVEPGTKIQFWTNDPEDSYAESAIVDLTVNGNFIAEGTEEEPIEIFPSELHSDYAVMIQSSSKYESSSNITLKHVNITNAYLNNIDLMENCEVRQNYPNEPYRYRYFSSNKVETTSTDGRLDATEVIGTAFYKLGGKYSSSYFTFVADKVVKECIFIDSYINVSANSADMIDNVFYGNNNITKDQYNNTLGGTTTVNVDKVSNNIVVDDFFVLEETGNAYMTLYYRDEYGNQYRLPESVVRRFLSLFDGEWVSINSKEELESIYDKIYDANDREHSYGYATNIKYDETTGSYLNDNGTKVPGTIQIGIKTGNPINVFFLDEPIFFEGESVEIKVDTYHGYVSSRGDIIEVPTQYPINITLSDYITNIEVGDTYQIHATTMPNNKEYALKYVSENNDVVSVDENGLITAVGAGSTSVKVYSGDLGTYNYITVNVTDKVVLEELRLDNNTIYLNPYEVHKLKVNFYPSNATERTLTYTSSNEDVVKISDTGYIEAQKEGKAYITIEGENNTSTILQVVVSKPATILYYNEDVYCTDLEEDDGNIAIPETDIALELIEWTSSDPSICYVGEQGQLIKLKEGIVTIRAKDKNSDAFADMQVIIDHDVELGVDIKKIETSQGHYTALLTKDGDVWYWNEFFTNTYPKKLLLSNIKDIGSVSNDSMGIVDENGKAYYYNVISNVLDSEYCLENIVQFAENAHNRSDLIAIDKSGKLQYLTRKGSGLVNTDGIDGKIVDAGFDDKYLYILTEDGYVYTAYMSNNASSATLSNPTFTLLDANVKDLYAFGHYWNYCADKGDKVNVYKDGTIHKAIKKPNNTAKADGNGQIYYIEDGKLIVKDNSIETEELSKIENVEKFFLYQGGFIIQTEDQKVYVYGDDFNNFFPIGESKNFNKPQRVFLGRNKVDNDLNYVSDNIVRDEYKYPTLQNVGTYEIEEKDFTGYSAISTKEELLNINNDLNGKYYLTNNIEFKEDDYKEGGVLYNDGYGFLPIGTTYTVEEEIYTFTQNAFTGVFDGNGYEISGLKLRNANQAYRYLGLFGISYGQISNLSVDVDLTINLVDSQSVIAAGGIVGYVKGENATVTNCSVTGNMLSNIGYNVVGGIVGKLEDGRVQSCENNVDISFNHTYLIYTHGGIVGEATNASIVSCVNNGNIDSDNYSGGIVAKATNTTIDQCLNNGEISATLYKVNGNHVYIGGLTGYGGTISNSYNTGKVVYNVYAEGTPTIYAGGLAGFAQKVENSYTTGVVETTTVNPEGYYYTGSLLGLFNGTANHVYSINSGYNLVGRNNDGTLNSTYNIFSDEALKPQSYVGFDYADIWDMLSLYGDELVVTFDDGIIKALGYESIRIEDLDGNRYEISTSLGLKTLHIKFKDQLVDGQIYRAYIPLYALSNNFNSVSDRVEMLFIYRELPKELQDHNVAFDKDIVSNRDTFTKADVEEFWSHFVEDGLNTRFYSNVILNRLKKDNVESWLRIYGASSDDHTYVSYGGNYWGTLDETLINKQIMDFEDYGGFEDVIVGVYDQIPENTYPFVLNAYLEVNGKKEEVVGNQEVTFVVEFNRDMDTSIPLDVKFGSAYPYADYKVDGEYVDAKTWKGKMQLTTIIENGYQYWSVSNGKAKGTSYKLYNDEGRFQFGIDTSAAQALLMQGEVTSTGIKLTWTQDDFDTLAGYNVYRSDKENGYYTKINQTLIPADTKEFFDNTVEPGQKYYYNFTVLKTDLTESEPSGKVSITALDTMAPDIYHSPVYEAFTGNNLVISASVSDNVGITNAKVFYRITGTSEYQSVDLLSTVNDKYTAVIPSEFVTTEGLEYYIEATDGVSKTYKASASNPYSIVVRHAVSDNEKGDVDGDGKITLQDAMKLLYAINDRYNMTAEEFERADLNGDDELTAYEALIIIQYVNGTITSIPVGI